MLEPLIPRLKREIEARLAELRPMVAEAERLAAAKEAMLADAAAESAAPRPSVRSSPAPSGAASERFNGGTAAPARSDAAPAHYEAAPARSETETETESAPAPRGPNQTAILAIVEERPGVSVAEIAAVTKIAKPTVATTVSKLKREGVLADEAGGVKLASRQPITLSQIAAAARPPSSATSSRDEGASDEEWEAARRDPAVA